MAVAPRRALLLALAASLLAASSAERPAAEATCPAGEAAQCDGGAGSGAPPRPRDAPAERRATLLAQEVAELRGLSELYRERIALLRELQAAAGSEAGHAALAARLPEAHVRALGEALPPAAASLGREGAAPAASYADFVVSKAVVPQEDEIATIKFLPLRNPRTASPAGTGQISLPSTLLVAARTDGTIRLFTPVGELATTFSAGHEHPLSQVAVSPLHDEYVIVTADVRSIVRIHKVSVRQRRMSKEEKQVRKSSNDDKFSVHLGSQVNVTTQFNRQIKMPNGTDGRRWPVSALAMASQQGTKYFIVGHPGGNITVITRNGTLHARINTGVDAAVDSFSVHLGTVVFACGGVWGFVDLETMDARLMECPNFEGRIVSALVDAQKQDRVVAADDGGAIWVFNVQNKRQCKIEHRFPLGTARHPVEVASVRGFTLALDHSERGAGVATLSALNMSHVGKKKQDPSRVVPAIVWRRTGAALRSWTVHKRYQQGDLLALLSEDGMEIEILEVLMQVYQQPQQDSFSNFKMPVFAVAIVMVLGYQYVKGKGAFDPGLTEGV